MTKILEYITLNYTWFLGGAILILLAIIGYQADKTNFGQGKSKEKVLNDNINSKKEKDIVENKDSQLIKDEPIEILNNVQDASINNETVELSEEKKSETKESIVPEELTISKNDENNISTTLSVNEALNKENIKETSKNKKIKNIDTNKLNEIKDSLLAKRNEINSNLNNLKSSNDDFKTFDAEFNSLMPEKEIIDNDILSDISNIEIDKKKNKKENLKAVPDLDNVELPRIKKLESSKKDIWEK